MKKSNQLKQWARETNRALAILIWPILFAACGTVDRFRPRPEVDSITLERTGCFGSCPIYVLTLYADGVVRFEGREYVKKKGVFTKQISREGVAAVFARAEQIGFWSFADHYAAAKESEKDGVLSILLPPTDMPTRYVAVQRMGRMKRVEDYWGAPAALHDLEHLIDATAGSSEWIGFSPKNTEEPNQALGPTPLHGAAHLWSQARKRIGESAGGASQNLQPVKNG